MWSCSELDPLYGDFTTKTWIQDGRGLPAVPEGLRRDKIDAPAVERRLNFHPEQVKLVNDIDSYITYCYRIKPENDNL